MRAYSSPVIQFTQSADNWLSVQYAISIWAVASFSVSVTINNCVTFDTSPLCVCFERDCHVLINSIEKEQRPLDVIVLSVPLCGLSPVRVFLFHRQLNISLLGGLYPPETIVCDRLFSVGRRDLTAADIWIVNFRWVCNQCAFTAYRRSSSRRGVWFADSRCRSDANATSRAWKRQDSISALHSSAKTSGWKKKLFEDNRASRKGQKSPVSELLAAKE